jgi:hypothetical protein
LTTDEEIDAIDDEATLRRMLAEAERDCACNQAQIAQLKRECLYLAGRIAQRWAVPLSAAIGMLIVATAAMF